MQVFTLRRSLILAAVLVVAHGTAMLLLTQVNLPLWLQLMGWTVLILNCVRSVRHSALLRAPDSTMVIEVLSDRHMNIQTRKLVWHECRVLGSSYVSSFLTIVNLRQVEDAAIRHIVIMPDAINAEDYRKLRVWLRWLPGEQPQR